jgi:hypothetical protein
MIDIFLNVYSYVVVFGMGMVLMAMIAENWSTNPIHAVIWGFFWPVAFLIMGVQKLVRYISKCLKRRKAYKQELAKELEND